MNIQKDNGKYDVLSIWARTGKTTINYQGREYRVCKGQIISIDGVRQEGAGGPPKQADPRLRDRTLRDLWMERGCPETMKVHVKSTGETITLKNGSVVALTAENNPLSMGTSKAQNRELRVTQPDALTRRSKSILEAVCPVCGNTFLATRKTAKYCSKRCCKIAERARVEEKARTMLAALGRGEAA